MRMTMKQWKHAGAEFLRFLTVPLARVDGLRKDDKAQVMVMTGVMVFVVMIFAMATLNTSELLHNRIQNQTAVDAAADAFALWQARGLNIMQHANDLHSELNVLYLAAILVLCIQRIECGKKWCGKKKKRFCVNDVKNCCRDYNRQLAGIEQNQAATADTILSLQTAMLEVFPRIGWVTANDVAKAAGADQITGPGGLTVLIDQTLGDMGLTYDSDAMANSYAGGPVEDVHVLPYGPPALGAIIPAPPPLSQVFPGYYMEDRCFGGIINTLACWLSTCDGGIPDCVFASNIKGCISAGPPDTCDYNCAKAGTDYKGGSCGWHDWWYEGVPTPNTWIAAKTTENLVPWIEDIRWLNPVYGSSVEPADKFPDDVRYDAFDEFAFTANPPVSSGEFENDSFITMASSHALGSADNPIAQPLQPHSILGGGSFQYSRPQIINVHLGLDDTVAEENLIWH